MGQAPLDVTLVATGDGVTYHWDLGDGAQADGPIAQHRYEAGRYKATVTATGSDGSTAQASVTIMSLKLTLTGPRVTTYGRQATFKGRLFPVIPKAGISLYAGDAAVGAAKANKSGRFTVRARQTAPATYTFRFGAVVSNAETVAVRPGLDIALPRVGMVGRPLGLRVDVRPRGAGSLSLRIWRKGRELQPRTFGDRLRLQLDSSRVGDYVVQIAVAPVGSFSGRTTTVRTSIYLPYLSLGARGPSVRILEHRLAELRYALRGVDGLYSFDTADAVLAFQKVHGMARTGRVGPGFWARLRAAHVPQPRYRGGHHIEVDKSRQVLFEVEGGHVRRIVHVSTGATGNTPVGRWHVYSKVPGFNAIGMFYSSFFLRGFAIHGYHSVPSYPASHGCVRIPIWVAPSLFASNSYGETIYVYY
jgi:PKD repeat protein